MLVKERETRQETTFYSLNEGDVFWFYGEYWIKTGKITTCYEQNYNSVSLRDGVFGYFLDSCHVQTVKGSFIEE